MAAPRYVNASTGSTDAMGAWSHTAAAPAAAGNVLVVQVLQDGTNATRPSISSVTNAEALDGTDSTLTYIGEFAVGSAVAAYQHLWIGRALNTSAMVITGANAGNDDVYIRVYEFDNVSTGTTLGTVIENATAGATTNSAGTSANPSDAAVTTLGLDRLALNFIAVNDDNAITIPSGQTGGSWRVTVDPFAEASGTDGALALTAAPDVYQLVKRKSTQFSMGDSSRERHAQSFTAPSTGTSWLVGSWLEITGSPTDDVVVEIQSDSSGSPSETVLSSATFDVTAPSLSAFSFQSSVHSVSLTSGTTYWIVWRRTGALDDTNRYLIGSTDENYPTCKEYTAGGGWVTNATERAFAIGNVSAPGGTIDGGVGGIVDSDAWGVAGFALIGTTVGYVPRHGFVNYQDPGVF